MVIVRRERAEDIERVRSIQSAAFDQGNGEPVEARLLDGLRACDGWIPELSLVAAAADTLVGHNVCTRGYVDEVECVGLGPIAVVPELQRDGIGSAMMHAMIGAADALGHPLIALLGSPDYYCRFGFVASSELGIEPPDPAWGVYFQALPLSGWNETMTGLFRYAAPFNEVD